MYNKLIPLIFSTCMAFFLGHTVVYLRTYGIRRNTSIAYLLNLSSRISRTNAIRRTCIRCLKSSDIVNTTYYIYIYIYIIYLCNTLYTRIIIYINLY